MTARDCALSALVRIEREGAYSNLLLKNLPEMKLLKKKDKSFCVSLVYGVLERKITLDYVIKKYSDIKLKKLTAIVLAGLRIGVYQLLYMDRVPESAAVDESVGAVIRAGEPHAAGYVNAMLRAVINGRAALSFPQDDSLYALSVRYGVSPGLIEGFIKDYTLAETKRLLESFFTPPRAELRVNTIRNTAEECLHRLKEEGVQAVRHPFLKNALTAEKSGGLTETACFKEGRFHMQGAASQLCCAALSPKPDERLLDICAAPGGKTATTAEMMGDTGEIIAGELHAHRVKLIRELSERLGLHNITAKLNDASVYDPVLGLFDRVLCDVPCSGLGVIAGKPELRGKNPAEFFSLPDTQRKILDTAARYVRAGGLLLYSTCTLRKAENEEVAEAFLSECGDFYPED
ncbi:MAG TPA: 16S rRNA (cytosine(967)-C(5))-methyltransferase RsmB, partial [Ruminococcaceae bacterium]|nr:16S rRNA (cytosine(967)-C(5))-methyltransferase RsmB [Oscillospiraceae bacterium]